MSGKAEKVLSKVLKKITPTYWERKETGLVLQEIRKATEKAIKSKSLSYTLAGSFLRDTWLPDKKEFDIFILFPESVGKDVLEKEGLKLGKTITSALKGRHKIAYAEHPYVRANVKGYDIDIVPCCKVASGNKIKSSVDRTPFHNKWLAGNLRSGLASEVRLLKRFCKGLGIYGSDTKVMGLSGYLAELLIINYGSFVKFLKAASSWEAGRVLIDITGYYTSRPEELGSVKQRFKGQPLIVIDPVDSKRNVAAALSSGNFTKLSNTSGLFLKKPSDLFFFPKHKKITATYLKSHFKKRKTHVIAVHFKRPNIIDDTLWPQLRKSAKRIKAVLEDYEFRVFGHAVFSDEKDSVMLFEMECAELPFVRKIQGPPVFAVDNSKQFRKKYRKARLWVEENSWMAEVKRKFREPEALVKDFMKGGPKTTREKGIGSYIAVSLAKKHILLGEKALLSLAGKNKNLARFLANYFENGIHI